MRCPRCSHANPAEAKFCSACGAPLAIACPACGHANPPGSRFCNECGQALGPADVSARPERFGTPDAYTPRHLVDKILTARAALEGERKQVTVLFADLKGSMELLADRDPEEARALLDPLLELMMEAVHHYEGTVNQVMGDGIMALFGAPVAHEDHAVRACYAALRMQETATRYGDEVQRAHGVPVQIRVGLHSGDVVVRSIGGDLRMDYTAVGQTTHLAARMEQMAKPGSVLLTAGTLKLAEGWVQVKPLGPLAVRGLPDPVEAFELTGVAAGRTRLRVSAARGLTRFVGRDTEVDALGGRLGEAQAGHGQVAALVGEAGVGKSRLVWELTHSHRVHGWRVLEAASVSYGKATAFLPVIDLLKGYFEIESRDDTRKIRERVTGRVLTLDETLKETVPALLSLLGAAVEDPAWHGLDAGERRQRTLDAVRRLLLRESVVQPVLVVLEDLHWVDAETQGVLDRLVESLPTSRLLLVVNYRPEYRHDWGGKSYYSQLRLDPLTAESADAFLDALLGTGSGLAPLKALLIERTQGNPFFLEESVRTLAETGVLAGERGDYRPERPVIQGLQVAATVQAMLAARIDRLPPEDKHLLQSASVIGQHVPLALLAAIEELPEAAVRGGLARLQAAEFLHETTLFPDLEYTFTHALTLEVAYGSLLAERRRALHARIVDALERLYPERLSELADRLAHHAFRGEVWGRALVYLRQTVAQASPLDLDTSLGGAKSAGYLWWTGDYEGALAAGQREGQVAASFANFGLALVSRFRLAQVHHVLGDYPRAIDLLHGVLAPLRGDLARETFGMAGPPAVFARAWLAWSLGERGALAEGRAHGEDGLRLAEAADHSYSIIVAAFGLGILHLLGADPGRAMPILERGLVLSRVANVPLLLPLIAAPLGLAYARAGRVTDGLPLLRDAVDRATELTWVAHQSLRLAWLAEAHLLAGQAEQAMPLARRALDLAGGHRERGNQGHAECLLGELLAHGDDPASGRAEAADAAFREALAVADELGMRPLEARVRLGLGGLYRRAGRPVAAQAELSAALELGRALAMAPVVVRAEGELAELR